jgi:aryl-alcohol dehydrogenase-like predicted oxidoreductase
VALAWLIGHGNVVAIPGARTVAHLEENVAAADLELSEAEMDRLTGEAARFEFAVRR